MPTTEAVPKSLPPRRGRPLRGPVRLWLIDLDDTLYLASAGMFAAIHRNMRTWIAARFGLPEDEAARLQHHYWRLYGATFLGLWRHHGVPPLEFLSAAHSMSIASLVRAAAPRSALAAALAALPGRKILFSNGPDDYAAMVLRTLGLGRFFAGRMTASDMRLLGHWRCKPDRGLLLAAARRGRVRPCDCAVVDDSPRNLKLARSLGMRTVWCRPPGARQARAAGRPWLDGAVRTMAELRLICPSDRPRKRAGVRPRARR